MTGRRCALIVLAALLAALALSGGASAQDSKVDTINGIFARLASCWRTPALPFGDPGMQITVRFSLRRDGELMGEPRITYETEHMPEERRLAFRTAVGEAMQRCIPMPLSEGLANAIAGRPMTMRFDARRMKSI